MKYIAKISSNNIGLNDRILWTLFPLWLVIDSINGYYLNQGIDVYLSQLTKFGISALVIIVLLRRATEIAFFVIFLITFYSLYFSLIGVDVGKSISQIFRFLSTVCLYYYFSSYRRLFKKSFEEKSITVLKVSFIVFVFNIVIGILGFGFETYIGGIGTKGWFYAGNELGGLTAVIIPFFMYFMVVEYKFYIFFFCSVLIVIISFFVGTKAVILTSILSFLFILKNYTPREKRKIVFTTLITFFTIGVIMLIKSLSLEEFKLYQKFLLSFESGGLENVLLSGRSDFLDATLNNYQKSGFVIKLFGLGESKIAEMDIFDTLVYYGIIGLMLTYGFYFLLLYKAVRQRNRFPLAKLVVFSDILVILISVIAGHVVYSSMSGLFYSLLNNMTENSNLANRCLKN